MLGMGMRVSLHTGKRRIQAPRNGPYVHYRPLRSDEHLSERFGHGDHAPVDYIEQLPSVVHFGVDRSAINAAPALLTRPSRRPPAASLTVAAAISMLNCDVTSSSRHITLGTPSSFDILDHDLTVAKT